MQSIAQQSVHRVSTERPKIGASIRLTTTQIAGLQPQSKRYDVSDPSVRGLVLRVGTSGFKSWLFRFKWNGNSTRIALGIFPALGLAEAREAAAAKQLLLKRGIDPRKAARPERHNQKDAGAKQLTTLSPQSAAPKPKAAEAERQSRDKQVILAPGGGDKRSVQYLAYEYVEKFVKVNREIPGEVIRILNKDVLPFWRERDARTISAREIVERLDAIVARGSPVAANRTADILGQMFKFGIHRAIVDQSPVQLFFSPGGREKPRKRVLTDEELMAFLHGVHAVCSSPRKAHTLRLLLLTLQRRSTVGLAEWKEFDFEERLWRIPDEHDKERRGHILPLTNSAIAELKALKSLSKGSRFVLPSKNGAKPASPQLISRSVTRLQERFQAIAIKPFTVHDLRRTGRTQLSKLGVPKHISERVLNHSKETVEGTYDLYEYVPEKRTALERWEKRLRELEETPKTEPAAEIVMKELFKEKLKRRKRKPTEKRNKV
jgi:integrase